MTQVGKLVPVAIEMFYRGMILPVDIYLNMSLNQADLLFRKKGDCLLEADLKSLRAAPDKAIRVRAEEYSILNIETRSHFLKEGIQNENFKSKEVKKAAADLLASVGNTPNQSTSDSLNEISEKVQDIIATMKNTPSVKSYFRLLESAKKVGDPLEIHCREVSALAVLMLMTVGAKDATELSDIATAGLLHDVGLRSGPKSIMDAHCHGQNEFSGAEKVAYLKHPEASLEIIKRDQIAVSAEVLRTIELHHENWDGSGFKGIVGNRIQKSARILRAADEVACRLSAAVGSEKFDQILAKISNLASQSQTSLFDPDIMLSLNASLNAGASGKSN